MSFQAFLDVVKIVFHEVVIVQVLGDDLIRRDRVGFLKLLRVSSGFLLHALFHFHIDQRVDVGEWFFGFALDEVTTRHERQEKQPHEDAGQRVADVEFSFVR